jgi:ribosomal protein S1
VPLTCLQVGDEIKAVVICLDKEQLKIGLRTKKLDPEPEGMLQDAQQVYEEAEARVAAYREQRRKVY